MDRYRPNYNEIIKTTGTPAYVFDTDVINRRIDFLKESFCGWCSN